MLLGPFFFENNMNGNGYLQILNEHVIPELMENFPVQQRGVFRRLWWAHDGTPAHRLVAVRNRLAEVFGHRVIALYHDVEWPPRSPDLTCCDFFLWGYLKSKVFTTPPRDIATLRQRIIDEFDALRHQAPMIRRAVREMEKRANLCVERNGGHVEGHGM